MVPISWDEFKVFFCKAFKDSRAFINSYLTKIRRDSQYELEEVLDWSTYLEFLQTILKEFDPTATPNEETLIRWFWENLHPFIWAQLNNREQDLDAWDKIVENAVNVKVKACLQSPFKTREIDSRCPKKYKPLVKKDKDNPYQKQRNKASNRDKKKLSPIIHCLPLINLRPRPPTLKYVNEKGKKVQPLGSTLPR